MRFALVGRVAPTSSPESIERLLRIRSAALDAAADAIAIVDRKGTFEWVNPAFCSLTGYSRAETLGKSPRELLKSGHHTDEFYRELWETVLAGRVWSSEITNRRKDGSTYVEKETITPVRSEESGDITHFVAIKRDLTDERRLEAQFRQAQKMDLVGRLSSGIAHDFNNILTVINGTAEMALMDIPENHPLRAQLTTIAESGKRATALTRQLLSFSRKEVSRAEPLDLRLVVRNFRSMLQRLIGEDIELKVECDDGTSIVHADLGQMEQVILNLAVNARDAMPGGGRLTISVRDCTLDREFVAAHPGNRRGAHVRLDVADTGSGMSAETMSRIFEPFFTTKEAGKGTGLGLATVYGIVTNCGGTIWPTSEPGKGTTFQIYLPVVRPDTALEPPSTKGTIAIVEQDDTLRQLAARILRSCDYIVVATTPTEEAVSELAARPDIQLIVADRELPVAVTRGRPILYTCGFRDIQSQVAAQQNPGTAFLGKPFTVISFLDKVRGALDRSRQTRAS